MTYDDEMEISQMLAVHDLAKAFVQQTYDAATVQISRKKKKRQKDGLPIEVFEIDFNEVVVKASAMEYIRKDKSFEKWCRASKLFEYSELVERISRLDDVPHKLLVEACNHIFYLTSKRLYINNETARIGAAISMLHGRFDIRKYFDKLIEVYPEVESVEFRSDIPFVLQHCTVSHQEIEKASEEAAMVISKFYSIVI